MKRVLTILLLAAAVLAAGLGLWHMLAGPSVTVVAAHQGRAVEAVYATAVVKPVYWGRVGATGIGRIESITAHEGDKVKAGAELARLDDGAARARIRELRARIEQLRADVARARPLAREGYSSRQSLEHAESELKQARAALAQARHVLNDLVLRAPLDGVVLRRDGEIGETVGPERILFWVGKPRPLRAEAEVDEEDIPRVAIGQKVLIKADAFPGRGLVASVAEITPKGDPVTKSYRVRLSLPDSTPLLIGMTVEANIVVRESDTALLIPVTALGGAGDIVWRVRDGRAQRVPVVLGAKGAVTVEVRDGLKPGDAVIDAPPEGLAEGARVRVTQGP